MTLSRQFLIISLLGCFLSWGCSSESASKENKKANVVFGKIELSDGWARPGSQGQTSGVYLTISNGTASIDTLLNVSSNAAEKVELHQTLKNKDGTMSMQPAGRQIIKDGTTLHLEPGGLHIMLVKLKRDLAVRDTLSVSLDFARVGTKRISVPVKIQH